MSAYTCLAYLSLVNWAYSTLTGRWKQLSMKYLWFKLFLCERVLYLQNLALVIYDQKCCPFSDHTNYTSNLQLSSLVQN